MPAAKDRLLWPGQRGQSGGIEKRPERQGQKEKGITMGVAKSATVFY
jgi:hypothetical protein